MAIPMFLAMTGTEMQEIHKNPTNTAWMACHFSPYGTGLSNRPDTLPPQAMLILNDRTPVCGHDPALIAQQLTECVTDLDCRAVLLDFQRKGEPETAAIVDTIVQTCPCPVAVSDGYAENLNCPVFLPPVPPNIPLAEHLAPWKGREIWLEIALDGLEITVTSDGTHTTALSLPQPGMPVHREATLHCHYDMTIGEDFIRFQLFRTPEDVDALIKDAERFGVTHTVGLYQEFSNYHIPYKKPLR